MSSGIRTQKGTYRKANLALGLSAVGLAIAYPFQNLFWGGLLTSGCSAALVGGLADWFAVNALFRRPLGVRPGRIFRTEIIPRNRDRIYTALSDMVQNELLSQEALKNKLKAYDFSAPLLKLWEAGGRKQLEEPLLEFLQKLLPAMTSGTMTLQEEMVGVLKDKELHNQTVYPMLQKALHIIAEEPEGKKVLEQVMNYLSLWAETPEVHQWLVRWLEQSITRYVNANPSRKFLAMFLPQPAVMADTLQRKLADYLRSDESVEFPIHWAKEKLAELSTNPLNNTLGDKVLEKLLPKMEQELGKRVQNLTESENAVKYNEYLLNSFNAWTVKLKESLEARQSFNSQLEILLFPLIEKQHARIGKMVREGLERYSDEMLVELIESKAGEDLQMIRINGSVVGGLVGMLIYILTIYL